MAKVFNQEVYQTLSGIFDFANDDQKLWWHSTAPMFEKVLQSAKYDVHAQYRHMGIYKKHIIPFLGIYPTRDRERWLSVLTRYGIPFELSLNCSESVLRYAFEPINAATGTELDPFNTFAIWESLQKLVKIQPGIDLEWFSHFKKDLTLDATESAQLRQHSLADGQINTQNQLALDLKGGQFVLKTYIYPQLKSIATAKSIHELVFDSVRKISSQHDAIAPALDLLEDYILSRKAVAGKDSDITLHTRFVSCDLVNPAKSRIKIYMLERMVSMDALEDLWTLGGRRNDPSTLDGLELVRELWNLLAISSAFLSYPQHHLPLGAIPNEQLPCMVNYTLHHGDSIPEPQLYLPVFGRNDSDVADTLTAFFNRRGWTEMAEKYKNSLWESFPQDDHKALNYIQSYISFSYRNNKPYLSVYLHSFESGAWPVLPDSPTVFNACRRDSSS